MADYNFTIVEEVTNINVTPPVTEEVNIEVVITENINNFEENVDVDLSTYQKTADADLKYAVKNHTHAYSKLTGLPNLFSGNYNDLINKPTLNFQQILVSGTNIKTINGQSVLGSGDISISAGSAFSVSYSDLTDVPSVFPPSEHSHSWGSVTGKPSFHSVATSGNYSELNGLPNIPAAQVNADWNAASGVQQILNKPTLFSGNYNDLTNKPALFNGSWNSLTGKPSTFAPSAHTHTAADVNGLATVATSGSYNDLSNKPTIPSAQVNSDWNATSGVQQILNKPTLFSGNYADLTGKPTLFDGTWNSLSGKPSTFAPSAHSHPISEVTGLQTALDSKSASTHTHDSITNQNGGTVLKLWTGTQAQYDALTTKDTTGVIIYNIYG